MGTGPANIPPPDDPGDDPGDPGDDPDEPTVETPAVASLPTEMLAAVSPDPTDPVGGGPTDPRKANQRKLMLILLGVFIAGLAVGGLVFALVRDDSEPAAVATTSSLPSSSTSTSAPTTVPPITVPPITVPVVVPTTESTLPRFTQFDVAPNPVACRVQNPQASSTVPASNPSVTIAWATAYAATVDVSVDGPGVYQSNIGAQGSIEIPYSCPGPHTFTLTAHGSGGMSAIRSQIVTSHP